MLHLNLTGGISRQEWWATKERCGKRGPRKAPADFVTAQSLRRMSPFLVGAMQNGENKSRIPKL